MNIILKLKGNRPILIPNVASYDIYHENLYEFQLTDKKRQPIYVNQSSIEYIADKEAYDTFSLICDL